MAWAGWLCFGGTTIIDECMTNNLQNNGHGLQGVSCGDCNPCCADLNTAMWGGPGGPNIAQAPWYDPQEPLSVEFAGLLVTSITGLQPGQFTRDISEATGTGASLGQARQLAPQITVTAILLGTCCGAEYGLNWLQSALTGSCNQNVLCGGDDLKFLSCPPQTPDFDCMTQTEVDNFDYDAWIEPYIRTMRNVALISGPTITNRISHGCPSCHDCPMLEVQFTLAAGDPHVYREAITLVETGVFEDDPENDVCIEWIPSSSGLPCGCTTDPDCATDPLCVDVKPPLMPSITNSCIRGCLQHDRVRSCFTIPDGTFPANGSGTLRISIYAGSQPMRNIFIQGWHNPLNFPPEELNDCSACFGITASYVAANSTLVMDGAARTSMIECIGGTSVRANPFIAGGGDSPIFQYPDFAGCATGGYTVCVYADSPVAPDASIKVEAIGFEG